MAHHRSAPSFYDTPAWRAIRKVALNRDQYRCVICGVSVGKPGASRVDHIHSIKTHPHLALALDNLRVLCVRCDNQAHREKPRGSKQRDERFTPSGAVDAKGWPTDKRHPWLNGR